MASAAGLTHIAQSDAFARELGADPVCLTCGAPKQRHPQGSYVQTYACGGEPDGSGEKLRWPSLWDARVGAECW